MPATFPGTFGPGSVRIFLSRNATTVQYVQVTITVLYARIGHAGETNAVRTYRMSHTYVRTGTIPPAAAHRTLPCQAGPYRTQGASGSW